MKENPKHKTLVNNSTLDKISSEYFFIFLTSSAKKLFQNA